MPYRQQFRNYAEHCLRLAELIDAPEQRASLIDTANACTGLPKSLTCETSPPTGALLIIETLKAPPAQTVRMASAPESAGLLQSCSRRSDDADSGI